LRIVISIPEKTSDNIQWSLSLVLIIYRKRKGVERIYFNVGRLLAIATLNQNKGGGGLLT